MQCTNFYKKYKELEAQEYQELAVAVKAHGREYVFFDCNQNDANERWDKLENQDIIPTIYGSYEWMDENERYYVTRVKLNESDTPVIYGFRYEFGCPSDENRIYNVEFGYLDNIILEIPETENTTDVSTPTINSLPVLVLSRGDVEAVGFNPNISDYDFQCLASAMSKALDMDDFWLSLKYACEHVGIDPLNIEDDA